ncbi:hypothetical protein BATDEDRAFT_26302 [Batrachochytrium dendrobatidis JAM81]|uniref:Exocyst complex component Sec8 n=1 Tax=Batrachochytrium dendrobatidis (strain JAM81 / FGSC 10211) TaxID=684364 RepID=F4P7E6_BATDJ|nr:uncharacterized protein BATDEDRAFT_26302 [Batrachochytrium dendrobatidis JAM81]EGF78900.1 hypothetical protein BATDEDRAFT_26302 [Batrachochytrium dendrobatidis JAM81]|eukprot:XP_006680355.1 hypothetical protein BATDEDRAFT_26302 [Batrachochytrium dendrobatidis JAM81]
MFAGRYRVGKRDGKTPTGVVVPGQEGNTRPITSPEIEEANSLPPLVTEVMSVFNPIPYALSLLDGSSLGRDYESFCDIHDSLEKAMDLIVNDYHQAFNSAIQTFSSVVDTISESQKKVQEMRENLEKSKNWLECKRFDLLHLWVKSIQFKEMSRILESMQVGFDELQRSPTKIQTLIDGKYYLTAVKTLVSSIRTLNASDVVDIGAMDTVKEKLAQMSKQVYDLILEEIHDHLYLKTAPAMARIEPILNTSKENVEIAIGNEYQFFTRTKLDYVFDQIKPELFDDFESNPETNSFCYLQALVESLKVLDKLEDGLKVIDSRVTQELFGVVEKTIEEQEHRHVVYHLLADLSCSSFLNNYSTTNQPLSHDGNFDDSPAENNPLASILLTLYDRFELCICLFFRDNNVEMLFQTICRVKSNYLIWSAVPYTASDICHAVQGEVKTVLYDYLITVEKTIASTNTVSSMNEILRDKRKPAERIGKQVFRINGASNSTLCVISENEDQDEIWKDADLAKCSVNDTLVGKGVVDKYANVLSNGHKPLIRPEASNILIAFKPTMQFTDSLEQAVGISPGVFHVFLEDFVLNVFLPQTHDLSVIALGYLLQSMCKMSNTIPIHKEEFLKSLEFILEKFHEKCLSRFRTLISTEQSGSENSGSISFAWTKNEKLTELMAENLFLTDAFDTPAQMNRNQAAWQKETDLEMKLKGERSFHRSELIFESRRLQGLAQLHYSMEWLAAQIMYMKGDTGSSTGLVATKVFENSVESLTEYVRLSSDSLPQLIVDSSELPQAEMTTEMANRFSVLANSFKALEKKCIYSLRVELRCHSMFLFDGLGELMAQVLIFNLRYIRTVNLNGVLRLVRNIQSLQQNLTNLACAHQESLDRAKTYYELLGLDVEAILKMIPKNSGQYTYDEYKAILDLKFHDAIVEGGAAIKPYEETIVKLKRYFIDHRN